MVLAERRRDFRLHIENWIALYRSMKQGLFEMEAHSLVAVLPIIAARHTVSCVELLTQSAHKHNVFQIPLST